MLRRGSHAAFFGILAAVVGGCELLDLPAPPFDATGSYEGAWRGFVSGSNDDVNTCAVRLTLTHDLEATSPEEYRVDGEVRFNFTCPDLLDELTDIGLPTTIQVDLTGFMTPMGQLLAGSISASGEATHLVGIDATGVDVDEDGQMDGLSGSFTLAMDVPDFDRISVVGTFEAGQLE